MPETTPDTTPIVPLTAEEAIREGEMYAESGEWLRDNYPNQTATIESRLRRAASWRLYAEMRQREENGGWLPMETAPKDGSQILVYQGDYGTFSVVRWYADDETSRGIAGWYVDDNKHGPYVLRGSDPTAWQPLPALPSTPNPIREREA